MTDRLVRTRSEAVLKARPDRMHIASTIVLSLARALVIFAIAIPLTMVLPGAFLLIIVTMAAALLLAVLVMAYILATDVEFWAFKDGFFAGHLGTLHLLRKTAPVTPWKCIEKVSVMKDKAGVERLALAKTDGETIFIDRTPDTLEIINCLMKYVPEKVHASVHRYLIEDRKFVFHVEQRPVLRSATNTRLRTGFTIIMAAYILLCALVTWRVYLSADAPAAIGALMALLAAAWVAIALALGKVLPSRMLWDARPGARDELVVPFMAFPRIFLSLRRKVPVGKIMAVRRKLHSCNGMLDQAEVKLGDGRWYDTNIDVFIWALDKQGFLRMGDMAVNPNAVPEPGFSLARLGPGRAVLSAAGLLVLTIGFTSLVLPAVA